MSRRLFVRIALRLQLTSNARFCAGVSTPMLSLICRGCEVVNHRACVRVGKAVSLVLSIWRAHLCHTDVGAICFLRRSARLRALRPLQHTHQRADQHANYSTDAVPRVPRRSLDARRALVQKSVVQFFLRRSKSCSVFEGLRSGSPTLAYLVVLGFVTRHFAARYFLDLHL